MRAGFIFAVAALFILCCVQNFLAELGMNSTLHNMQPVNLSLQLAPVIFGYSTNVPPREYDRVEVRWQRVYGLFSCGACWRSCFGRPRR